MNNQTTVERQRALDYLHSHPWAASYEIMDALGWERRTGTSRLRDMVMRGELDRRDALVERVDKNDRTMVVHTCEYIALVMYVLGEEAHGWRALRNPAPQEPVETAKTPARYVHNKPDRKPIPNQGGQGCIGHRPRGSSSLDI